MGWKVLLYSCPRCEFDNALDDLGVPWVGGTKLPPGGTEEIRSQPAAAQGVADDSLDASKPITATGLDLYSPIHSKESKRPPPVRVASEWTAIGYPPDLATAMESLQRDLIKNYASGDALDVVVLRPHDEKGDEMTHLARVPYHSDMLPHWKYLMKSINEDSDKSTG